MDEREIAAMLHRMADEYPPDLRAAQHADVRRIAFHIATVVAEKGAKCSICDIGGGVGLFSVGCSALGMNVTLVDDFGDAINTKHGSAALEPHRRHGVRVLAKNVTRDDLEFGDDTHDAVTSFDSMEHWHHSPKALFHRLIRALRPGGLFLLGVPNCVNLRKRITVLIGRGKWSTMADWYEPARFRGHVREPDVDDLRYIARDLGLSKVRIIGKNWLGYQSRLRWVRALVPIVDRPLQQRPSLCSDIYLLGRK
jgi:SAM-dependent methyltransferase